MLYAVCMSRGRRERENSYASKVSHGWLLFLYKGEDERGENNKGREERGKEGVGGK